MNAVFADTFFYQALLDARDPAHPEALAQSKVKRSIVTTDLFCWSWETLVPGRKIMPTFWRCWPGFVPVRARASFRSIPGFLQRGLDLFADRPDKNWSLTDCVSFVVMQVGSDRSPDRRQSFRAGGFQGAAGVRLLLRVGHVSTKVAMKVVKRGSPSPTLHLPCYPTRNG